MYITTTSQIISVGVVASKLPLLPLVGREYVLIQNVGSGTVYLGNVFVTANTANTGGYQLLPSGEYIATYTDKVDIYGIIVSGSSQVLVQEGK